MDVPKIQEADHTFALKDCGQAGREQGRDQSRSREEAEMRGKPECLNQIIEERVYLIIEPGSADGFEEPPATLG